MTAHRYSSCQMLVILLAMAFFWPSTTNVVQAELKVGAAKIDITPEKFPVLLNGGMLSRSGESKNIHARAVVLDDGEERIAIVVADSCMMPKDLLDGAKDLAAKQTKIKPERMLISATHTHTAPSACGALGTDADPAYVPYLRIKLAEVIAAAEKNLQPAQVGFGKANAAEYTALRRWILRPDKVREDPFGNLTVRANMHAAKNNLENVIGESGPEDPDLSVISFQTPDGKPIALLANFSMHYFSGAEVDGSDYFGPFCDRMESNLQPDSDRSGPAFVAIMSHGCSGDIWRMDYRTNVNHTLDAFLDGMVGKAMEAYESIEHSDADLTMAEQRIPLDYRLPDKQRLEWAQRIVDAMVDDEGKPRPPKDTTEVYAREQVILNELKSTEVVVQALRIGDIAIATTPCETYALTGLKLKRQSPLEKTMVIELANGGDGYIPPPEQHYLGGYNTWAARSAGLEVQAEPKIVATALGLLEEVTGKRRRLHFSRRGPAAELVSRASPVRYWRMEDMHGPKAWPDGYFEPGCTFFLEGPVSSQFCADGVVNRAVQFSGGRLHANVPDISDRYGVSVWIYNGMVTDARDVAGWFFSKDHENERTRLGEHLGVGGKIAPGKLLYLAGDMKKPIVGKTEIPRWEWNHVYMQAEGNRRTIYLNGNLEITTTVFDAEYNMPWDVFIGGRSDNDSNWQGRLDEVAIFNKVLTPFEIANLSKAVRAIQQEETEKAADSRDQGASQSQSDNKPVLSELEKTQGGRHWVDAKTPPPKSPEETLKSFQIEPGVRIELVAAEPLVMDPVAIAFDRNGRMFVVEYGDYPIGPADADAPPLSRVVMLEDTDGDGQLDKRHVFADKLNFAHSLMPYRDGLLVCAQTEILYLVDKDGDHQADERTVLFKGFTPAHPQMQIGNPRWGLDNKIYFNYGVGEVTGPGEVTKKIPRTEFWFDPLTLEFGPAAGLGQYGNTIDAWGNRFFATNRNPIIAAAIDYETSQRNPYYRVSSPAYDVAPSGGDSQVFPLIAMKSNWLSHAGTHTSACGTTAYVGDLLGAKFADSVFVCEPIGHLVTRSVVKSDGVTLTSTRARPDADFLASTDEWFRPASLANGPDGALYLADMYRLWVEHPKFLPPEVAAKLDWRAGEDRGRIWRIVPDGDFKPREFAPPKTSEDMVALLSDRNGWRRRLGQQLLVEAQDNTKSHLLAKLITKSASPVTRLHALWTLYGLKSLSKTHLEASIQDYDPRVRAAAVQLAVMLDHWPVVAKGMADEDIRVRNQAALAVGSADVTQPELAKWANAGLAKIAINDGADAWMSTAILTSAENNSVAILELMAAPDGKLSELDPTSHANLVRNLAMITGLRNNPGDKQMLFGLAVKETLPSWFRLAVMSGVGEGLARNRVSLQQELKDFKEGAAEQIAKLASLSALDSESPLSVRITATELLAYLPAADQRDQRDAFAKLLRFGQPVELQLAAARSWDALGGEAEFLLKRWQEMDLEVRNGAVALFLRRKPTTLELLTAISGGKINRSFVSIDQQNRLLAHADPEIQQLSQKLFGVAASEDRKEVLARYQAALEMKGSAAAGKQVFAATCAKCHKVGDVGKTLGPDLADSLNRPRDAILFDILDPSAKVEPKYNSFALATTDGRSFTGLLVSETADEVVLQSPDAKPVTIPRNQIEVLRASKKSLMPDGLEKEIGTAQMANLLEFLKQPFRSE